MSLLFIVAQGCLPLLPEREKEIHWESWPANVVKRLETKTPVTCTSHPVYKSPNPSLPYDLSHQLLIAGHESSCSELNNHLLGTDLGLSVHFGGGEKDIIYFGDTLIPEETDLKRGPEFYLRHRCAYKPAPYCDDVYGFISDNDPTDGVDLEIQGAQWAHLNRRDRIAGWNDGFASIRLMGINTRDEEGDLKSDDDGEDLFGEFNAPSGAMAITTFVHSVSSEIRFEYGLKNHRDDQDVYTKKNGVLMFFATANNVYSKKKSWLGCTGDLVTFRSCSYPRESEVTLFSEDKFIHVSPVPLSRAEIDSLCATDPDSILCNLLPKLAAPDLDLGEGALLFGNGKYYRCSPMYLAYLELSTGSVWYFDKKSGTGWSEAERDATAIIEPSAAGYDPDNKNSCPFYSREPAPETSSALFGEASVKLVENRLIMLSNHLNHAGDDVYVRVYYRTAPIDSPHDWSRPQATEAVGYGPYILDRYTEIENNALIVHHMLSTWNPSLSPEEPYAVVTTQLRLMDTGKPPSWTDGS